MKHWTKLRTHRRYREETGSVLVNHSAVLRDLPANRTAKALIVLDAQSSGEMQAERVYQVTPELMQKITGLPHAPDAVAELALPLNTDLQSCQAVLVLDGIADPGNLGTLLRSALALGFDGVFCLDGTADPFGSKALAAGKGAAFHLPMQEGSAESLQKLLQQGGHELLLADLEGEDASQCHGRQPFALCLGSEVEGIRPALHSLGRKVTIPMKREMESLNVAVAGGILMYLLGRNARKRT
ncbi:MAG: RNA methyltransferase [Chlamydiia bacterium]|nr:RNA methyltransferase [Chlamydiia bacterium]